MPRLNKLPCWPTPRTRFRFKQALHTSEAPWWLKRPNAATQWRVEGNTTQSRREMKRMSKPNEVGHFNPVFIDTNCVCGTWIDIFLSPEDWMETREGGWCISARVICYTYKMQRLRLLWGWRLGQPGFSACGCKMLTLSWLPYPLVERSFFTFLPSNPPTPRSHSPLPCR